MGAEKIFGANVFGDSHFEHYPYNPDECSSYYPKRTLKELLFGADYYINLGDNSGRYSREIFQMINEKGLENIVSVLGNHDIEKLFGRKAYFQMREFYEKNLNKNETKKIDKYNFGNFGDARKKFNAIENNKINSEYKIYYTTVESNTGPIGLIFRHYPFYFNRQKDLDVIYEVIKEENPVGIYSFAAHSHKDVVSIKTKRKSVNYCDEKIPLVNVVIPPFTLGHDPDNSILLQHISYPKQPFFYASIYNINVLEDGSVSLNQRYFKNNSIKNRNLGNSIEFVEKKDFENPIFLEGEFYEEA